MVLQLPILPENPITPSDSSPRDQSLTVHNLNKSKFMCSAISQPQRAKYEIRSLVTYEGIVTKYIDNSVVELDHEYQLYLYHYLLPNQGRELRIGSHVRLDNVHVVFFKGVFKVTVMNVTINTSFSRVLRVVYIVI